MLLGRDWVDVSIQNLSSRGLMAKTRADVTQRSYVEIRRGDHIVVGRVVWCRGGAFGLRSQDRIDITGMVGGARSGASSTASPEAMRTERRAGTRNDTPHPSARRADRSRLFARRLELVAIGAAGVSGCVAIAFIAARSLQAAFAPALTALGG